MSTILVFIPVDRAEISHMNMQTTKFVPVTEPALLPGSYAEAGEVSFRAAIKEIIANAVSSDDLLGSN